MKKWLDEFMVENPSKATEYMENSQPQVTIL